MLPINAAGQVAAGSAEEQQQSKAEPNAFKFDADEAFAAEPMFDPEDHTPWLSLSSLLCIDVGILPRVFYFIVLFAILFCTLGSLAALLIAALLPNIDPKTSFPLQILGPFCFLPLQGALTDLALLYPTLVLVLLIVNVSNPRRVAFLCALQLTILLMTAMWLRNVYDATENATSLNTLTKSSNHLQSFSGCASRIEPLPPSLSKSEDSLVPLFNSTRSLGIRNNQISCSQGFEGNADLYGLGARISIYLQWLTALFVNNALPKSRSTFRSVYLIYSLGLTTTTYVFTFFGNCTFAIEIEILYWAYWGGFLCVFASSPSYTRLGSQTKWIGLDWASGINYVLHTLMLYHGIFFWLYGHALSFSQMPCGTVHFFLGPLPDPSRMSRFLYNMMTICSMPLIPGIIFVPPAVTFLLASEIKKSFQYSYSYRLLLGCCGFAASPGSGIVAVTSKPTTRGGRSLRRLTSMIYVIEPTYRQLRKSVGLPSHARAGIRLVRAVNIKQRKYVS